MVVSENTLDIYLHSEIPKPLRVAVSARNDSNVVATFAGRAREWTVKVNLPEQQTKLENGAGSTASCDVNRLSFEDAVIDAEMVYLTLLWYFQHSGLHMPPSAQKPGGPLPPSAVELDFGAGATTTATATNGQNNGQLGYIQAAGLVEDSERAEIEKSESSINNSLLKMAYSAMFSQLNPSQFCAEFPQSLPPKPLRYVLTGNIRHPSRSMPVLGTNTPFYERHIRQNHINSVFSLHRCTLADTELLHRWMNNPRVAKFWGEEGPQEHQHNFIKKNLESKHCFPAIGSWQDIDPTTGVKGEAKPACYYEIYWVKEDHIARYADGVGEWDRGVHVLVGEEWARGRVAAWLNSLIHYMFLDDPRTQCIFLEPRVDNKRFIELLMENGFYKEKEFAFPHKQSALMRLKREAWKGL